MKNILINLRKHFGNLWYNDEWHIIASFLKTVDKILKWFFCVCFNTQIAFEWWFFLFTPFQNIIVLHSLQTPFRKWQHTSNHDLNIVENPNYNYINNNRHLTLSIIVLNPSRRLYFVQCTTTCGSYLCLDDAIAIYVISCLTPNKFHTFLRITRWII